MIDGLAGVAAPAGNARTEADRAARLESIREVATKFEAVFLAQMLDHAGVGKTPEAFGGGAGEDAFRRHLIDEQARLMSERGGIGLAETIVRAMAQREGLEP